MYTGSDKTYPSPAYPLQEMLFGLLWSTFYVILDNWILYILYMSLCSNNWVIIKLIIKWLRVTAYFVLVFKHSEEHWSFF